MGVANLMECGARTPPAVKVALVGLVLLAGMLGNSYIQMVGRLSARHSRGAVLASRDGLLAVTRCPEQLQYCETQLHNCGEQAVGCEALLTECRRVALRCKSAMDATRENVPGHWYQQVKEDWDVRFKGHGLGQRPKNPHLQCGKHGFLAGDGTCRCTVMYAGRDCQHGYAFTWQLYTRFDKVEKRTPERRKFNGEYWGSYILSQDSLLGGLYPGPQNWHGQELKLGLQYRDLTSGKQEHQHIHLGRADDQLFQALPDTDVVGGRVYNQCAIVGSSGSLLNFQLGRAIDRHDMVLRFNGAPTKGFEKHVGSRTTFRLVTTPFLTYNEIGETVLHAPRSEKVVQAYRSRSRFAALNKKAPLYLLDPGFLAWQASSVLEWQPTVAWTGIMLAMQICRRVDLYGLMVAEPEGSPYHYFDTCTNPASVRAKAETDIREWTLMRSFKDLDLLHFMEPCVVECRASDELCMACRRRAPGFSETISPEMHDLRLSRKRIDKRYCKKADLHHMVADAAEAAAEAGDDGPQEAGGAAAGSIEAWTRPQPEAREEPFNPLMG